MAFLLELGELFEGVGTILEEGAKAVIIAEGAIKVGKGVVNETMEIVEDVGKFASSAIPTVTGVFGTLNPTTNFSNRPRTQVNENIVKSTRSYITGDLREYNQYNTHELFKSTVHGIDHAKAKQNPFHGGSSHKLPSHADGLRIGYATNTDETPARTHISHDSVLVASQF